MPNSWGYPKQVQEWVPEQPNTKLAEKVADELEKTISTYQAGELLKGLWERDFDSTKDVKGLLKSFDRLKERYKNMRDELCHNQYLCFTDTQNTTILKGKRHLVTESEYLTGKKALSYLLALLKMIK